MSDNPLNRFGSLTGDAAAAGAIFGTAIGWLPYIAAFAGFVWYLIQIWESRTVQIWWTNRRLVHRAKKIARLRAREKVIVAALSALELVRSARVDAREKVATAKVTAAKMVVHDDTVIAEQQPTPYEEELTP